MNDSIVFYRSFFDAVKDMPPEEYKECMNALLEYCFDGIMPGALSTSAHIYFTLIRPQIDANFKRREDGKKGAEYGKLGAEYGKLGGRPKKEKPPMGDIKNPPVGGYDNPPNVNVNVNGNVNENVNVNANENVNANGTYNLLTEGMSDKSDVLTEAETIIERWNQLQAYGIKPIRGVKEGTKRMESLRARLRQYSISDFNDAIENIKQSDFLQGKNRQGWIITFDWFILPSNFQKVLEGNYDNREIQSSGSAYIDAIKNRYSVVDSWLERRAGND